MQVEHEQEVFLTANRDAPGEITPRLVYADWLDERGDPDGEVRFRAAFALGKIGDHRAFDVLARLLKDEAVRYDAAVGLGWLGDTRAVPVLERLASVGSRPDALDSAARTSLCRLDPQRYEEEDC